MSSTKRKPSRVKSSRNGKSKKGSRPSSKNKPSQDSIVSVLAESRVFNPPKSFSKTALIGSEQQYKKIWRDSVKNPTKFWAKQAKEQLEWIKPFKKVLSWKPPFAKWFEGGKLNVSVNCLDRHVRTEKRNKAAIIWEGEPGDTRVLTYHDLLREVSKCANALNAMGVKPGHRVAIYMPMIPEIAIAMLACTRIGAMHTVVFGGFSSEALADRCNDSQASVVITADGGFRKGANVPLKKNVDAALEKTTSVKNVLVVKRTGESVTMKQGRDHWWHDVVPNQSGHCEPYAADSEHPLFLLYTSGSTGKPKGILHTTAGYLLGATISAKYVFDLKETDTYWCTADAGWVTGHSYIVYGPLANGATAVMYEGAPNFPDWGRLWSIVEKHHVSILYTAPTAIRACIKAGDEWPKKYNLKSLRLLGSVGEPINPEAWIWYHEVIGGKRCPIVDTWWQTETGSMMITPIPGAIPQIPGSATKPFFGIDPEIVDKNGNPVPKGQGGFLVIKKPWPSMLRTIWGDDERFKAAYWSQIPGVYFTGDGARQDKKGNFWIMGRIDDVLNVSGHRLSTMEIESALVSHDLVAESAVVGRPDDLKGEGIICFVTLKAGISPSTEVKDKLSKHVVTQIGALARPDEIRFADALPKTRSGKIMRRLLRDVAAGKQSTQDTTTLEDLSVLANLRQDDE
jgi:acetyl-CoA synthetase